MDAAADQNSIVMNPPSFDSSGLVGQQHNQIDLEVQQQAPIQMDPIHSGIVRVVYGPVLQPHMIWKRTFSMLLPEILISDIPYTPRSSALPPYVVLLRFWSWELDLKFINMMAMSGFLSSSMAAPSAPSSVSIQEIAHSEMPMPDVGFQFVSQTPPVLGKRTRNRGRHSTQLVAPVPDFSTRRMTRSCAKLAGFKPTSTIPLKPLALRRPCAKKLCLQADPVIDRVGELPAGEGSYEYRDFFHGVSSDVCGLFSSPSNACGNNAGFQGGAVASCYGSGERMAPTTTPWDGFGDIAALQ